jgi:hypothetical protein
MGRGKSLSAPAYRLHKSTGQAVVRINGKTIYLGKHGTEESQQRYHQALADLWSPPGATPKPISSTANDSEITVTRLAVEYAKH